MKLKTQLSDSCLRALVARRLGKSIKDLDDTITQILKDTEAIEEISEAETQIKDFSLSSFNNYRVIEVALNDYVLLMLLNEIYKDRYNSFFFGRMVSGLAIENIAEAIIGSRLKNGFSYKFVDKNGIDFMIVRDSTNIGGIQCKALVNYGKGKLGSECLLEKLGKHKKKWSNWSKLWSMLLCGYLYFPKSKYPDKSLRAQLKESLFKQFKNEGWPLYLIFTDQDEYTIDPSLMKFIEEIESFTSD